MSLRVLLSGFVAFGVALLIVSTAAAQRNRNPAMQPQPLQPIKISGTLASTGPNMVQLTTNQNQTIYVMVGPNTQVSVTGTAEQDYLKSGVTVEFVAEVAKGGAVTDKIGHLRIVSLTADRPAGLSPPEPALVEKKGEKGAKPEEEKPLLPGGGLLDSKPAKGRSSAMQFPGKFTVRGAIKLCKDGKLTVAASHGPTIKADLAGDLSIDVDMVDLRAAQRDDRVTVNGLTSQARPNMVMAESIKIELANPLSGAKKHAARPAKTPAAHAGQAK